MVYITEENGRKHVLESIDFSRQNLLHIPEDIFNQHDITSLYLNDNKLTSVPVGLFDGLCNLTWLDLRFNHLTELPAEICQLRYLQNLLLNDNQLTKLPPALGLCYDLTGLHLSNNPLVDPSVQVCRKGCAETLKYLRQQIAIDGNSTENKSSEDKNSSGSPEVAPNSDKKTHDVFSEFNLWRTQSSSGSKHKAGLGTKSETTVRAAHSFRKAMAQRSSAFLSFVERITLRRPIFPTVEIVRTNTQQLRQQKADRTRQSAILKELEHQKQFESVKKWRHATRIKQLEKMKQFQAGQGEIPSVNPPFAQLGDRHTPRPTRPHLGPLITGLFTTSSLNSREQISAVRQKIHTLIERISLDRNRPVDSLHGPDDNLARAQQHITELQQISRTLQDRK